MNILLLGSGGREHALAWKMSKSNLCKKLYTAPGNPGTATCGENIDIDPLDFEAVAEAVRKQRIDMVVVGPEAPLVAGIRDFFEARTEFAKLLIVGPGREAAQLEGSKDFAKAFMARHGIPTARYKSFNKSQLAQAKAYLRTFTPPYVLKADGLAAGKGVVIPNTLEEAERELDEMLGEAKFGAASATVVIEEFLKGIELSVFALCDGKNYVLLPEAKDYKRIGEGDKGLNTGGMGAVSPVLFVNDPFMKKVEERIVKPTIQGLHKEGLHYVGFVFFGLINVDGNPFVIEYNCRLGDPETEAVLPRVAADLVELLRAAALGKLEGYEVDFDPRSTATIMAVAGGYPGAYEKGKKIQGLGVDGESILFHAGTTSKDGHLLTNGGRVLAVTAYGKDLDESLKIAYSRMRSIRYEGKYVRRDIGYDLQE